MQELTAVVVEDDHDISTLLSTLLRSTGFVVHTTAQGREAAELVAEHDPDLVTLDLTLPDLDGLDVCRQVRAVSNCYVMVVSARQEEADRLIALDSGADDYVLKPFTPQMFRARVAALLRRPRARIRGIDCGGGLHIDPDRREVTIGGVVLPLTRMEYDILTHLSSNLSRVCTRAALVREIWGSDLARDTHLVDVHVANLRAKLRQQSEATWIHTIRGVGYRLDPVADPVEV